MESSSTQTKACVPGTMFGSKDILTLVSTQPLDLLTTPSRASVPCSKPLPLNTPKVCCSAGNSVRTRQFIKKSRSPVPKAEQASSTPESSQRLYFTLRPGANASRQIRELERERGSRPFGQCVYCMRTIHREDYGMQRHHEICKRAPWNSMALTSNKTTQVFDLDVV
jgi:hypothetical protein